MNIGFWWRNLMERGYMEDLSVYDRITLICTLKKPHGRTWTELTRLRIGARALVNTVMNIRVL